jgi:hypothetical protein
MARYNFKRTALIVLWSVLGAWCLHTIYNMGRIRGIQETIQIIYDLDKLPEVKPRTSDPGWRNT